MRVEHNMLGQQQTIPSVIIGPRRLHIHKRKTVTVFRGPISHRHVLLLPFFQCTIMYNTKKLHLYSKYISRVIVCELFVLIVKLS